MGSFPPFYKKKIMSKFRIAVLGIGGVGGFVGGKLADYYKDSDEVEIIFLARGKNGKAIKENGLKLITSEKTIIVRPSIITNSPETLGAVNLVICCVKGYSLEESLKMIKPCVTTYTLIFPLLNGVDAPERIRKIIPNANVVDGCIYIISKLIEPGVVKESGIQQKIFCDYSSVEFTEQALKILQSADIKIISRGDIQEVVWEKFIFISPMATLTSYLDLPIGGILESYDHKNLLLNLLKEVKSIADAKGIFYDEDIIEKTIGRMKALPYSSTTSCIAIIKGKGKTEVESLTGYVVRLGKSS